MALAQFFSRAYTAIGGHLGITRKELEKILQGQLIGIQLGNECDTDGNEKWIAEMLTNILARLYPSIAIVGSESARKNAAQIALRINPDIKIVNSVKNATQIAYIGKHSDTTRGFDVSASGWVAKVGQKNINGPANPYSAGAAAAIAAWRIFSSIFSQKKKTKNTIPDISLSLLDYSTNSGISDSLLPIDLGEVAVVGLGAVGNPAIWAWKKHMGLTGRLHLIDPEDVELSNLQRYCLPFYKDKNISKVSLAKRELAGTKLRIKLWPCTIENFAQQYKKIRKLPTICISVDNVDGRRAAQALLPKLVINGWTSDNGLGTSWHRFLGNNACLGCLYHPGGISLSQTELAANALGIPHDKLTELWVSEKPLESEEINTIEKYLKISKGALSSWTGKRVQDIYSGVVCGQVGIDLPGLDRIATVPLAHQSILAGIFMAAELIKRSHPKLENKSQVEPLIIWDDVLRLPPKYWTANRQKNPECFCEDEIYKEIYIKKWGK